MTRGHQAIFSFASPAFFPRSTRLLLHYFHTDPTVVCTFASLLPAPRIPSACLPSLPNFQHTAKADATAMLLQFTHEKPYSHTLLSKAENNQNHHQLKSKAPRCLPRAMHNSSCNRTTHHPSIPTLKSRQALLHRIARSSPHATTQGHPRSSAESVAHPSFKCHTTAQHCESRWGACS